MADILGEYLSIEAFEDNPDLRQDAGVVNSEYYEDNPDLRWDASIISGTGSTSHTYWLMRALTDPAGVKIYWTSIDSPDYSGSSAPEPVQVSTIILITEIK